jgi:hypothetical protein
LGWGSHGSYASAGKGSELSGNRATVCGIGEAMYVRGRSPCFADRMLGVAQPSGFYTFIDAPDHPFIYFGRVIAYRLIDAKDL